MPDEVKAARERVRRVRAGESMESVYREFISMHRQGASASLVTSNYLHADHATLADAYLTAHPADDGEPADLEFITSELRKVSSDWTTVASTIGIEATSLKSKARITAFNPNGFTRTSVRSLLSALGVETPQQ